MSYDLFMRGPLPRWALVEYRMDPTEIADVALAVARAFAAAGEAVRPGQRVCLTAGSRGIDRIDQVLKAAVEEVRRRGAEPFIIPAMGSHGGATAQGQRELLASLGVTEEAMGCPIRSSMERVLLGAVEGEIPVFVDRIACEEADVIIPINRVKPHTDFHGPVESGLLKMIAIGLGNQRGADTFHSRGFAQFDRLIPAVGRFTLSRVNIPFGLALVENGYARLCHLEAVPAGQIWEREQALCAMARERMARLPLKAADLLVLDYIGKDISGLGMDSNVVGRYYTGPTGTGPELQRIIVRDLTEATEGNAVGLGMADVALARAVAKMDRARTYMNCITAKTPEGARVPITVETDREALAVALACCLQVEPERARLVRIRDTKHLDRLYVSEPLLPEVLGTGRCRVVEELEEIAFTPEGMFANEVVA